jgi:hypothetical protein
MNGSSVVIGSVTPSWNLPTNPGKYYLGGPSQSFISAMDKQTLLMETIEQNATHTVLTFEKLLDEGGEPSFNRDGTNTFIVAHGFTNTFAYHEGRAVFQLDLTPCVPTVFDNRIFVNETNVTKYATYNFTMDNFTIDIAPGDPEHPDDWIHFDPTNGLMTGRAAGKNNNNNGGLRPDDAYANAGFPTNRDTSSATSLFAFSTALLGIVMCFLA